MGFKRTLVDIPELVGRLRDEKARQKDVLASQLDVKMNFEGVMVVGESGPVEREEIYLHAGEHKFGVMEQAHGQVALKMGIPKTYYDRMKGGATTDKALLCNNVNHWLKRESKKKRLIRTIDGQVRAFLGSRYRPVSHLDLVTQAVMVVTGQEDQSVIKDQPWAQGARCFSWMLNPMNLDVSFVNPRISVDLNNLDKGVDLSDVDPEDIKDVGHGGHAWLNKGGDGHGRVFPAVRIRNSETGHGGLYVTGGLYEQICDNTAHFGSEMSQIHMGRELTEAELWSPDTNRRINEVIFGKVRDVMRNAFQPELLLAWAKRFKGLEDVQVHDVKDAVEHLVEISGMNEGVRDDILAAYHAMTPARNNLFDVQRAVTGAAHAQRENRPDTAASLEDLGGLIIEKGAKILVGVGK